MSANWIADTVRSSQQQTGQAEQGQSRYEALRQLQRSGLVQQGYQAPTSTSSQHPGYMGGTSGLKTANSQQYQQSVGQTANGSQPLVTTASRAAIYGGYQGGVGNVTQHGYYPQQNLVAPTANYGYNAPPALSVPPPPQLQPPPQQQAAIKVEYSYAGQNAQQQGHGGANTAMPTQMPSGWPPALVEYSTRGFDVVKGHPGDKQTFETHLSNLINKHIAQNTLHSHRWDTEPIPELPSAKAAAALAAISHGVQRPTQIASSTGIRKRNRLGDAIEQPQRQQEQQQQQPPPPVSSAGYSATPSASAGYGKYGPANGESAVVAGIGMAGYGKYGPANGESAVVAGIGMAGYRPATSNASPRGVSNQPAWMTQTQGIDSRSSQTHTRDTSTSSGDDKGGRKQSGGIYGPASASSPDKDKERERGWDNVPVKRGRGSKGGKSTGGIYGPGKGTVSAGVLSKRRERFARTSAGGAMGGASTSSHDMLDRLGPVGEPYDPEKLKVVGVCQTLEKDYLRLTAAPEPESVRPEEVLKRHMAVLVEKWNSGAIEELVKAKYSHRSAAFSPDELQEEAYLYVCSQLKAVRQDLTVQHIVNEFTVEVYETHARIALECGDLNEYNQCQTQLYQFYERGLQGHEAEFIAYRILYYVQLLGNVKYGAGSSDLNRTLQEITPAQEQDPAIQHALQVRHAVQMEQWLTLFRDLYRATPNKGSCLLELVIPEWRMQSLQAICKAYRPHLPILVVLQRLGFNCSEAHEPGGEEGWEEGIHFLRDAHCLFLSADGKTVLEEENDFDDDGCLLLSPGDGLLLDSAKTKPAARGDVAALI